MGNNILLTKYKQDAFIRLTRHIFQSTNPYLRTFKYESWITKWLIFNSERVKFEPRDDCLKTMDKSVYLFAFFMKAIQNINKRKNLSSLFAWKTFTKSRVNTAFSASLPHQGGAEVQVHREFLHGCRLC